MDRHLTQSVGFNPRSILALLGLLLVLTGVGLLLFFAYLVFQIVDSPENVRIVEYIKELTQVDGPILNGKFIVPVEGGVEGPARNADFEVEMSPEIKAIIFLFMGAFALTICVNIVKIIITAGSAMIKVAGPGSGISITTDQERQGSSLREHLHYKRALEEERRSGRN